MTLYPFQCGPWSTRLETPSSSCLGFLYAESADFKVDEEFPFLDFNVFIVSPGIICKHMWVYVCVHFSEKADLYQILKLINDHKIAESSNQKYFYFGKCLFSLTCSS